MTKTIKTTVLILGVLVVAFLLGPTPRMEPDVSEPQLPQALADLEAWVADSESRFNDIVENTEKTIVWHGSAGQKTRLALLYVHGFSASRQEIYPVIENLAAELQANVYLTRLPGHGRGPDAMGEVGAEDWAQEVWTAYRVAQQLGDRVVVIGTSTGATLLTWLHQNLARIDHPDALIYLSPNFSPRPGGSEMLTLPWAYHWVPMVMGDRTSWEARTEAQDRYWTTEYSIRALIEMRKVVDWVQDSELGSIKTPSLFVFSKNDNVISPQAIEQAMARWGTTPESAAIEGRLDTSPHVFAGDALNPQNNEAAVTTMREFIERILGA